MTAKKCLLTEVTQDRLDEKLFYEFLDAYGWYWHNCHAEGRINESELFEAESNMIRYARSKGLRLHFERMEYTLHPAVDSQTKVMFPMRSRHAPTYIQVSDHLRQAIETILSLSPDSECRDDDLNAFLKEADEVVRGSKRMIKARKILTDCYEFDKPDRMGRIAEILRYCEHLWWFAEKEQAERSDTEPCIIDIEFVEFIPDSESDYPYSNDRYIMDEANHAYEMMDILTENNIIKRLPDRREDHLTFVLNEPGEWCQFTTDDSASETEMKGGRS